MNLKSSVALGAVACGLHVKYHVLGLEDTGDVNACELTMGDSGDGGVELLIGGKFVHNIKSVLALNCGGISPGVKDGDVEVVFLEGLHDVDYLGVAYVGAVLLESETKDNDVATKYLDALLKHEFNDAVCHIGAHAVVHTASCEDNFGIITITLGALREIVGVYANAVSANQSRLEGKEIPFSGSGLENVSGVDAHEGEYLRELVDESDVDIAL